MPASRTDLLRSIPGPREPPAAPAGIAATAATTADTPPWSVLLPGGAGRLSLPAGSDDDPAACALEATVLRAATATATVFEPLQPWASRRLPLDDA